MTQEYTDQWSRLARIEIDQRKLYESLEYDKGDFSHLWR